MASLFIKDPEAAALAGRVALRLGTTKTEAVKRALRLIDKGDDPLSLSTSTNQWLREYRAAHPLPDREQMKINKAFFDSLSGEENIIDPWAE
ncbi:type II toxin-antitoxin system VapB family antitoxin [Sphingomonas bacterium]|uniref:type II toxin-antitoxin system VapB family antitoxin n=1 Tax=Sphingomonas bacterium TaxID=1895847 RepID=UPI001575C91D|nr:type II toxin-antitoxin system VapB family antitoxin [Sphingomonas bacterium]